jgi:hypothetical protein
MKCGHHLFWLVVAVCGFQLSCDKVQHSEGETQKQMAKNAISDIRDSASREILISAHVFEKGNGLGIPLVKLVEGF